MLRDEQIKPFLVDINDVEEGCFKWNGKAVDIDGLLQAEHEATLRAVGEWLDGNLTWTQIEELKEALKNGKMPK